MPLPIRGRGSVVDIARVLKAVPVLAGGLITALLLWFVLKDVAAFGWEQLALAAATLALGIATVFLLQRAARDPVQVPPADQDGIRHRIAPMIIMVGAVGIAIMAIVAMVLVYYSEEDSQTSTLTMSIFTAVLPVFATWVSTVIASYFSSETYRQAADAVRQGSGEPVEDLPITTRMVPVEKVTSLTLGKDDVPAEAAAVPMERVRKLFSNTITRVVIFDAKGSPVYILRGKLDMPPDAATVGDYVAKDERRTDATNFRFLPKQATVGDGRRTLKLYSTVDIFITDHGSPTEPVRGWVADDRLA